MSGMPAALKARVLADCQQATVRRLPVKSSDGATAHYAEIRAGLAEGERRAAAIFGRLKKEEHLSKNRAEVDARIHADPRRHVLTRDAERRAVLRWESPRVITTSDSIRVIRPPQAWTDPRNMQWFQRLAMSPDGAVSLADLQTDADFAAMREAQDRCLVTVDREDKIRILSQPERGGKDNYPGAAEFRDIPGVGRRWVAVPDEQHSPRWRREHGLEPLARLPFQVQRALVIEAVRNLMQTPRPESTIHASGVGLTIREITSEANRIRSGRADLDGCKWLHTETVRLLISGTKDRKRKDGSITPGTPGLLAEGLLTEAEPPRREYRLNEWITHPRVYAVPADITVPTPLAPRRRLDPSWRRRGLRHALEKAA